MANYDDQDKEYPVCSGSVAKDLGSKLVEGKAQFCAGKSKGVQTKVAEYIAQKSGGSVVCLPKTRTKVYNRVAVKIVQEEDANG